jgi:uncharacterized protein (TIGR02145 family)
MKYIRFIICLSLYAGVTIILQSCVKHEPTVITVAVSEGDITTTTAIVRGTVFSNGGEIVTERGICYGIYPHPTDEEVASEGGNGNFEVSLVGLAPGTVYFIRAYAKNDIGTSHGADESFKTKGLKPVADFEAFPPNPLKNTAVQFTDLSTDSPSSWQWSFEDGDTTITSSEQNPEYTYTTRGPKEVSLTVTNSFGSHTKTVEGYITVQESITDVDNNIYPVVQIGEQWWMAENLRVTHYNDTFEVLNVSVNQYWSEVTFGAYCAYENSADYAATHGLLYNRYAIVDPRKLCPEGSDVPDTIEWKILLAELGGMDVAGGRLKQKGTSHWTEPNEVVDTSINTFNALPGGWRSNDGVFEGIGDEGYFWTESQYSYDPDGMGEKTESKNYFLSLYHDSLSSYIDHYKTLYEYGMFGERIDDKGHRRGMSVRCILDDEE